MATPKNQSLPKPKPGTRQISPKPPQVKPDERPNKYAPQELITRPGLGNLRVIDTTHPEYKP